MKREREMGQWLEESKESRKKLFCFIFEMGDFMACLSADRNDAPMEREKLMLQDKDGITGELKRLRR